MRHRAKGRQLSRTSSHRRALLKNVGEKARSTIAELRQREGLNVGMGFEEADGELRVVRPGVAPMAQPSAGTGEV